MKVLLPAITGLVPDQMVHALSAFLEFYYLVHHSQIDEAILLKINTAIECFHKECEIFIECGI